MEWYCIYTRAAKERSIAAYCDDQLGIETYLPLLQRRRNLRGRSRKVTEPMFPRYLFCKLSLASHFRAIRYAKDVCSFISRGQKPLEVEIPIIERLKSWSADLPEEATDRKMVAGDPIAIESGPFMGLTGVYLRKLSKAERVAVLLNIMNQETQVVIDSKHLANPEDVGGFPTF